jgi:hypothetical protein
MRHSFNSGVTQEQRILWLLQSSYPNWVPAISLAKISLQYSARIFSLRRKGWQIANRVEIQPDGTKHGSFRLAQPGTWPNPRKPVPVKDSRHIDETKFVQESAPDFNSSLFGDLTPPERHRDDG